MTTKRLKVSFSSTSSRNRRLTARIVTKGTTTLATSVHMSSCSLRDHPKAWLVVSLLNRTPGSSHTSQHPKVRGSSLYGSGVAGDVGFGTCMQFGAMVFCPPAQLTKSHRREHKRKHQGKLHSPKQSSPRPTSTVDRRHREHSRVWIHCPIRIKQKRPVPARTYPLREKPEVPHYAPLLLNSKAPSCSLGHGFEIQVRATSYKDTEV